MENFFGIMIRVSHSILRLEDEERGSGRDIPGRGKCAFGISCVRSLILHFSWNDFGVGKDCQTLW